METSLRNAALWGADTVLLVPAVVDAKTSYRDAWTRSQRVIRERLLPLARELKVVIAVEEVWNKFLLSPIEFARYVDEFDSPLAERVLRRRQRRVLRLPAGLDSHARLPHRQDSPEGLQLRSAERPVHLEEHRRGRHRLARGAPGAGGHRLCRLRDDRSGGGRRRVPEGSGVRVDRFLAGEKPVA